MGVVNTKSGSVTNSDAVPLVRNNAIVNGGRLRCAVDYVAVAAADDDTSVYRVIRLHSNCRVDSLLLYNTAITAGTSYDVGIYKTAADGGAVVDADAFGSAVDLSSAHSGTDVAFEALALTSIKKTLWEVAGLSADPNCYYDIALTANTVGTAAGTIALKAYYVTNS
ncbi:MAG: hypothetical protein EKK54_08115 [Neisseriaceae bacterium]|nr:MAG: hypothetical protein EKK54_08115 [Neisseriaceae bacterium]